MLTGNNGILNRAGQAKEMTDIAQVEELANLELLNSLIGTKTGNQAEKGLVDVLETLKTNGVIEAYAPTSSITGFNFNGVTAVNIGTSEGLKTKVMQAEFTGPQGESPYYVQIKGKKYPISKTNGKITIEKTEIAGSGASAKLTSATSNNSNVATVEVTEDNKITITRKATGETTITVKSTGLPDVNLTVNVKRETTITVSSDTTGCTVSPTSVKQIEGEKVELTATLASGKKLKGWYVGSNTTPISTDNPYNDYEVPTGTNYVSTVTITAKFEDNSSEIAEGVTTRATYGKYVNYNINLEIGTANDVTDDWKVFYDDGTNIFIIAADYVPTTNTLLANVMTNIGAKTTNKTSYPYGVYWDSSSGNIQCNTYKNRTTISLADGAADIFTNRPTGTAFLEGKGLLGIWKAQTTTSGNSNAKMTASLMDTKVWEEFAGGALPSGVSGTSYAIGGPTLSMFAESWNKTRTTQVYYNRASATGYNVKAGSKPSTSDYSVSLSSDTGYSGISVTGDAYTDDLYFPHKAAKNNCYGYWLASPSAAYTSLVLYVRCSGGVYASDFRDTYYGVRPVVCLPSGIGLKTNSSNSNLYDITNNQWD